MTIAFDHGDVGVMSEPIDEGDDAGGVGENGRPVFEGEIGRDEDRSILLITRIDDLVEQIGSVVVVGEVAHLVDTEKVGTSVDGDSASSELG